MEKFDELEKFDDFLATQLQNADLKKEYDALEPEFAVMRVIMEARIQRGMTQQQLAELTGIDQADISRLERGSGNPSLKTIQRIADALGKRVQISFV